MSQLLKFIWKSCSIQLRLNVAGKGILSLFASLLDVIGLILFAQLLSSLVRNDTSLLFKIFSSLNFRNRFNNDLDVYRATIVLIIITVLVKSAVVLFGNRTILRTLSGAYENITKKITDNFFKMHINEVKAQPTYEIFLAINSGVRDIFIIGASAAVNICTELIVITMIFSILIFQGGFSSLFLTFYFIVTFFLINKLSGAASKRNSEVISGSNVSAAVTIQSVVESFREIKVYNSLNWFLSRHSATVEKSSKATVDLQFAVIIPKVILESTFIIGIALFTWFKVANGNVSNAVVEIVFLAAMGSRIIPSLLRLQFSSYQLKQVAGSSVFTLKLLSRQAYQDVSLSRDLLNDVSDIDNPFNPEIVIEDVEYTYAGSNLAAVSQCSLKVFAGESVGIVGRTGSGKSTLIDLLLGALEPSAGAVRISNLMPREVFKIWSDRVGFVPQNISLIDGSLKENLLLGRDGTLFDSDDYSRALDFAGLTSHIDTLELGIETLITRAGSELSGGQRQKLGIARAVLTQPSILILDEATSSLDAESEGAINAAISNLRGKVTLVVVAHRLTTIKSMDRILLMENGILVAEGTYEELIVSSPTFKSFVQLSEL